MTLGLCASEIANRIIGINSQGRYMLTYRLVTMYSVIDILYMYMYSSCIYRMYYSTETGEARA